MNGVDASLVTLRRDDLESLDLGPSGEVTAAGASSAASLDGGVTPGEEGVELVRTEFDFSCAHGHDHVSFCAVPASLTAGMTPPTRASTRIRSSRGRSPTETRTLLAASVALLPLIGRSACRGLGCRLLLQNMAFYWDNNLQELRKLVADTAVETCLD